MKKTKITINTKIKYTDSKRYQKHFTLDDRIMIQKIITEHRDKNGKLNILLKDIGNMMENDPSTISKEVNLHRIFKGRSKDSRLGAYNSICSNFSTCNKKMTSIHNSRSCQKNVFKCMST